MKFTNTFELPPSPWENGGGVTREIARSEGPNGFAWRLSMADVDAEGAFSNFPGMSRILTVIEGDGLELHSPEHAHDIPFCMPFSFSGETEIRSVLRKGKIRDFNVIYDSDLIVARVTVLTGAKQLYLNPSEGHLCAVLGVCGAFKCAGVAADKGAFAHIDQSSVQVEVPAGSRVLVTQIASRESAPLQVI